MSSGFRIESDSLGSRRVPVAALYGVQTDRAIDNFAITSTTIGQWPFFIKAFACVKRSCAKANHALGRLSQEKYDAIAAACDEVMAGNHLDQFPVDVIQGGAGTSTNMNVNEVLANVALRRLGHAPGSYQVISPNDDVNMSQSTNDCYPTAARLACILVNSDLLEELGQLAQAFDAKAKEFARVLKLGRTQLQDAVPMTLGQEFSAFATVLTEDVDRNEEIVRNFYEVSLGGTAIGTGLNAPAGYADLAIAELADLTGIPFRRASNLIEASWDLGALVLYSSMLRRTAVKLSKIANDLRLLSSGPHGGLAEIALPDRQPGSSIMPGKVNPVIPEVVSQVCFAIIGNDVTIAIAAEAAQLQLNAMAPIAVHKTFESAAALTNAIRALNHLCVRDIRANPKICQQHLDASTARVTALVPMIGYQAAATVAKLVLHNKMTLEEAVAASTDIDALSLRAILSIDRMVGLQPND